MSTRRTWWWEGIKTNGMRRVGGIPCHRLSGVMDMRCASTITSRPLETELTDGNDSYGVCCGSSCCWRCWRAAPSAGAIDSCRAPPPLTPERGRGIFPVFLWGGSRQKPHTQFFFRTTHHHQLTQGANPPTHQAQNHLEWAKKKTSGGSSGLGTPVAQGSSSPNPSTP